jgi:hypothetical protein
MKMHVPIELNAETHAIGTNPRGNRFLGSSFHQFVRCTSDTTEETKPTVDDEIVEPLAGNELYPVDEIPDIGGLHCKNTVKIAK